MNFQNFHQKLFPYAYNILGSSEDAKDAVQDVLTKYHTLEKSHVKNETGFLIKSTINHSINLKNKKSKTLSNQVWLPEPIETENPVSAIDTETILSYSMLVLLEKLTAKERAIFILREAFDYSHKEIADIFELTVENSRKLLSRAKSKLSNLTTNSNPIDSKYSTFLKRYIQVMKKGDVAALEKLLEKDILLAADGGENIKVVRDLTTGAAASSRLLIYVYKAFLNELSYKVRKVNHQPAIIYYQNGIMYNCQVFELKDNKIQRIYSIVDPAKLKSLHN